MKIKILLIMISIFILIPTTYAACSPPSDTSSCVGIPGNRIGYQNDGSNGPFGHVAIDYDISNPSTWATPTAYGVDDTWEPESSANYGDTAGLKSGYWSACKTECLRESGAGDLKFGTTISNINGNSIFRSDDGAKIDFTMYLYACANGFSIGTVTTEIEQNNKLIDGKRKTGLYAKQGPMDFTLTKGQLKYISLPSQTNFKETYTIKVTGRGTAQHQSRMVGDTTYDRASQDAWETCILRMIINKNLKLPNNLEIAPDDYDSPTKEINLYAENGHDGLYIYSVFSAMRDSPKDDLALDAQDLATCLYNWDECMGVPLKRNDGNTVYECGCCTGFGNYYGNYLKEVEHHTITVYRSCNIGDDWVSDEQQYACDEGSIYRSQYAPDADSASFVTTLPKGTIIYIGNTAWLANNGKWEITKTDGEECAADYECSSNNCAQDFDGNGRWCAPSNSCAHNVVIYSNGATICDGNNIRTCSSGVWSSPTGCWCDCPSDTNTCSNGNWIDYPADYNPSCSINSCNICDCSDTYTLDCDNDGLEDNCDPEICDNGLDDDCDGLIDYDDSECICPSCDKCGSGWLNLCDRDECNSCAGGCYYNNIFGDWKGNCYSYDSSTTCESYRNDQTTCLNDPASIGNCYWDGSRCCLDSDGDNYCDIIDNCPIVYNPDQLDSDSDGFGDICEECDYEPSLTYPTEKIEVSCDDGIDNDCNGLTDMSDDDCRCLEGTTLCADGYCRADCGGNYICDNDGVCDDDEGCDCIDCHRRQDNCKEDLACDYSVKICVNGPPCPKGTTLCANDMCCSDCNDCEGPAPCDNDGVCDDDEGCDCIDCDGLQDNCQDGLVCDYSSKTCTNTMCETDEDCSENKICCDDSVCRADCSCVNDGNCAPGEGCPCYDCDHLTEQDPDTSSCLCELLEEGTQGVCGYNEIGCWDPILGRCCGDDGGETWTYSTSYDFEDILVKGTCYNGKWYNREKGDIIYYGIIPTE